MDNSNIFPVVLVGLIISISLFLLLRELANWYWKINERIENQKETNLLLEKILMQLEGMNTRIKNQNKRGENLNNDFLLNKK